MSVLSEKEMVIKANRASQENPKVQRVPKVRTKVRRDRKLACLALKNGHLRQVHKNRELHRRITLTIRTLTLPGFYTQKNQPRASHEDLRADGMFKRCSRNPVSMCVKTGFLQEQLENQTSCEEPL